MTKRLSVWGKTPIDNEKNNQSKSTTTKNISWTKGNGFDTGWDVPIIDSIFDGMNDSKQNPPETDDEDNIEDIKQPKKTKTIPRRKARGRMSISISVSLDEDDMFRNAAYDNDMNVSEFARIAMYRYIKYLKHKQK